MNFSSLFVGDVSIKAPCYGIGLGGPAPFSKGGWRGHRVTAGSRE